MLIVRNNRHNGGGKGQLDIGGERIKSQNNKYT